MDIENASIELNEALSKLTEQDRLVANYRKTRDDYARIIAEEEPKRDPLLAEVKAKMAQLDAAIKAAGK
jgi:hypothetical protein